MQMNAGLILGGQQPDMINVLGRSNEAAQQRIGFDRQNAINALYQQQGPGIAAGEEGALNALAQFDPAASLGIQDARLGMDATRQTMTLQADQAKRQAAEYARGLSAEQRAAEAAQLEKGLSGAAFFYSKGDRAGYEGFLKQNGLDPAQFAFYQFPAYAATMGGVLDVLKGFQPEAMSPSDRYKVAGGTLFDLGAQGGPVAVGQGAMQEETIFGPDGKPMIVRGGPGTGAKFTEGQSKDNVYAARAEGALANLDPIAGELADPLQRAANIDPTGIVRGRMQSDNFQIAQQAGEEYLQAILRKDTGAAITTQEQELYGKTYLPQPGDNSAVLDAKRVARTRAIEAIRAGMSPAQQVVVDQALVNTALRAGSEPPPPAAQTPPRAEDASLPGGDIAAMELPDLIQMDVTTMSIDQLRAFNNRMKELGQ